MRSGSDWSVPIRWQTFRRETGGEGAPGCDCGSTGMSGGTRRFRGVVVGDGSG